MDTNVYETPARRTAQEMAGLNGKSAQVRGERAKVRAALRSGALSLSDAMLEPPAALHNYPLIDVVRLARSQGLKATVTTTKLGADALAANVNLMIPLGKASVRSRAWVAEYTGWHWGSLRTKAAA